MSVSSLAPWYGSNRMLAKHVGEKLRGCGWVGVPCGGGLSELQHIQARTVVVGDLHRHIINLARVAADPVLSPQLYRHLRDLLFHPDTLSAAQQACVAIEAIPCVDPDPLSWAINYFVCCWMSRSGTAGTKSEFKSGIATRWNAAGGDSAVRFRSATRFLVDWRRIARRCTFECLDIFDFLKKVKDEADSALYIDLPFPGPGDQYKHPFDDKKQRLAAKALTDFQRCRVVCRFYDVPLIRELYPESDWSWFLLSGGRKQTNDAAPEVLIVRNGVYTP